MAGENNTIKVGITAELNNYKQIVQYITDGIEKGLVDGVSEKALQKVINRISTTFEQLKLDNLDAAFDSLAKIGSSLLNISESINVAAGAAESNIAEVNNKLNETRKLLLDLEKHNPKGRYRELTDSQGAGTGHYVRNKAGLQRELVGITSEEAWKAGKATFTGTKGTPVEIDYGGKTWSIHSAINRLVEALNDGTLALTKEIQSAIKEFGYAVTKTKENIYQANRQDLTVERVDAINAWKQQKNDLQAQVDKAEADVKEAEANVEVVRIHAETGEFVTPNLQVAQTQDRLRKLEEEYTESVVQQTKAQTQNTNAAEAARDAQDQLTKSVDRGTDSQRQQNGAVTKAVTTFFGYQMVIRQLRKLWNEAIRTIREMDRELTNQAIVTNLSRQETWNLITTYQELADQAGVTQTQIAQVTTEYLRQGETLQDALTLTKAAVAAATVAGISTTDSVKYLTTAIHGFKLEAEDALDVSDKFAALAAQAATNYEDLAIALSKVASQAALAGMSMDYTLALLTTGLDVTQEAPESIGTALKTVIARMREISDYGKTLEDDLSINQVQNALDVVGIQLTDITGELRSSQVVLDELGRKWNTLSANQQAAIAKALAGTRQQSRLVAILDNYDKVIEQQEVSMNAIGATTAQQVEYLQGMEAAMNRMQNAYQTFIETITSSDLFVNGINFITNIVQKVTQFLSTPAGKTALFAGIASILLKSEQLIQKIQKVIQSLIASLTKVTHVEQDITKQKERQLQIQRELLGLSSTENSRKIPQTSRLGAIASLFHFGSGYRQRVKNAFADSPWNRKSLSSAFGFDKKTQKSLKDINKELDQARKNLGDAAQNLRQANKDTVEDLRKKYNDEKDALEKAEQSLEKRQVYDSHILSYAEKRAYIEQDMLEKDIDAQLTIVNNKLKETQASETATEAEKQKTQAAREALEAEKKKLEAAKAGAREEKNRIANKAQPEYEESSSLSNAVAIMQGVTQTIAGIATLWGLVEQKIQEWQDYPKELAQQSINEATKIQAKIYENTQLQTNLKKLSHRFSELSQQAIQTTDSLRELGDIREQLLTELNLTKEEAAGISDETLLQRVESKNLQINEENQKYLDDMRAALASASAGDFDFGNVLSTTGAFAGTGAAIGGGAGTVIGGVAGLATAGTLSAPLAAAGGLIGGAIGGAVGGVAGLITGLAQEIQRAKDREDTIQKIQNELETDDGVEKWQYYLKASFTDLQGASQEFNKDVKSLYGQMIDNLSGDELKELFERYDWDIDKFMSDFTEALAASGEDIHTINSQYSSYAERIAASKRTYERILATGDKETAEAFKKLNSSYFYLDSMLQDASRYLDQFKLRLTDVNAFLTLLKSTYSPEEAKQIAQTLLAAYANGEDVYGVTDSSGRVVLDDQSIRDAYAQLFSKGQDRQSVAEYETQAASKVNDMRNTQSQWNTMTRAEQERFIAEHEDFFTIPGARQAFLNGQDITPYLKLYQQKMQQDFQDTINEALAGNEIQTQGAERDLAKTGYALDEQGRVTDLSGNLLTEDEVSNLTPEIRDLIEALRKLRIVQDDLTDASQRAATMFDLSWQQIVEKEQEQLSVLKEMYQKQEQDLTDSLNRRKEAYQKYFDDLASQEAAADYAQNRDQLIESISRLSAGTDATSRNKISDLRKQLAQIEKEETKRQTEEARQKVLENIDTQIQNIEDQFEALLNNNKALLDTMDENTYWQRLNNIETLGLTDAEKALAIEEAKTLFRGRWTREGQSDFNNVQVDAVPTPQSPTTDQEPQSIMNLSIGNQTEKVTLKQSDMKELIKQMFTWLNANAGTHFIV